MCPISLSGVRWPDTPAVLAANPKYLIYILIVSWHTACNLLISMKIAELRQLKAAASVRGTEKQDTAIAAPKRLWHRQRWVYVCAAGGVILALLMGWLIRAWSNSNHVIAADRLRIVTVANGHFVRDVAAQGTVIAAVNPTLFAIAPGHRQLLGACGRYRHEEPGARDYR